MKHNNLNTKNQSELMLSFKFLIFLFIGCVCFCMPSLAQGGAGVAGGMAELNNQAVIIKNTGRTVCYAIAVIALLVGAVRVMSKVGGEREGLHKEIGGWMAAAIFFAVVGFVVDKFVG
jgi:Domain of unknown function (DUF4134)